MGCRLEQLPVKGMRDFDLGLLVPTAPDPDNKGVSFVGSVVIRR
jgi:hypothetical protein